MHSIFLKSTVDADENELQSRIDTASLAGNLVPVLMTVISIDFYIMTGVTWDGSTITVPDQIVGETLNDYINRIYPLMKKKLRNVQKGNIEAIIITNAQLLLILEAESSN